MFREERDDRCTVWIYLIIACIFFFSFEFQIKREIGKRRFEKEDMKTYLSFFCSGSNPVLIDDCFDFELRSPSLLVVT